MQLSFPPPQPLLDLVFVARDYVQSGKELIGGLLCCSVFEIYIKHVGTTLLLKYRDAKELINDLRENQSEKISLNDINRLDKLREKRNDVMHANSMKKSAIEKIEAYLISDCIELVNLSSDFFLQEQKTDEEYIADATFRLFPNSWLKPKGDLPPEILPQYFADLIVALREYMQPLGKYLQEECLDRLDDKNPFRLKFNDLSRVNRSSGYIWISAVPASQNRRDRVYFPGLTVLFMPHEIAVYLELPGKSHKYKRVYYEQMLQRGKIKDFLSLAETKRRGFEFFHTWWYAMRQPVGSVADYLNNRTQKRKEWELAEKTNAVLADLNAQKSILTQNFFLIGKGYSRDEILGGDLRYSLHKEIVEDLNALYRLQKILLDE
jgi:hypothetical protein